MSLPSSRESHVESTRVSDKAIPVTPRESGLGGDQFRPENLRLFNPTVRMAGDGPLPSGFPSAEVGTPKTHTVASGDSLWSIASKTLSQDGAHKPTGQEINSYIHQIAKHNSITNPHKIRDGVKLELPEYKANAEQGPTGETTRGRRNARGREEHPAGEEPTTRRGEPRAATREGGPVEAGQRRPARAAREGDTPAVGSVLSGVMSHYGNGDGFHGRRMANGRIFDKEAYTVAHNGLPKGTMLEITGPNGKTRTAEVTDRGGFEKYGRQMDVSHRLARELGFDSNGTADFTAKVISLGDDAYHQPAASHGRGRGRHHYATR